MFIKTLNPVQREAATFGDGPLLILAGAGSGKTRVLTARTAWLVTRKDVPPGGILAVTFTNKAAGEMRGRLGNLIGPSARDLWLGTFHSLGLRILRRESRFVGATEGLTVYNDDDQLQLVKEVMKDLSISDKSFAPRAILYRINQAKNENVGPEEFAGTAGDFLSERVAKVYTAYNRRLREMNCRDFGDLITEPITLFKNNPGLLEKYRSRFRYILVDEYQDTNRAQYVLTNMLASGSRNIFAVGDPDQSIYAWRGADISNILDFERDYPDATVLRLEQNYRSTKTILDAANAVIQKNARRLEKNLWTENSLGASIVYEEARDEYDEARRVIRHMNGLIGDGRGGRDGGGMGLGDMAVFYRTNAQSRVFEEELIRKGVPYTVVGGVRFYDRMEIRDAIAYLRLAANPDDVMSFQRVVNRPARKIGAVTVGRIKELAAELGLSIFDALKEADSRGMLAKTRVRAFIDAFESFKSDIEAGVGGLGDKALKLLEDSGYMMMYQEEATEEAFERVENLFEFISAIKDFEAAEPEATLAGFLDHVALVSDIDSYDAETERLTLMTIHSAKGLEFKAVFVAGMEEGIFPHSRSMDDPEELEEERRLCYVGMTRAMERLFLTSTATRHVWGETRYQMRSRFIDEIPAEHLEMEAPRQAFGTGATAGEGEETGVYVSDEPYYTTEESQVEPGGSAAAGFHVGMRVAHPNFGVGVIKDRTGVGEEAKLTIKFRDAGVKKLAVKYAILEPVG